MPQRLVVWSAASSIADHSSGSTRRRVEPKAEMSRVSIAAAAAAEGFVYVGKGGYFFSAYTESSRAHYFKLFGQWMEGCVKYFEVFSPFFSSDMIDVHSMGSHHFAGARLVASARRTFS
jgi:hypothetical protein